MKLRDGVVASRTERSAISVYGELQPLPTAALCCRVVGLKAGERSPTPESCVDKPSDRAAQLASSWSRNDHEDGGPTIQLPAAEAAAPFRRLTPDSIARHRQGSRPSTGRGARTSEAAVGFSVAISMFLPSFCDH